MMTMTMLNRLACVCLIGASLTFARAQSLPQISRNEDARPRELISEGLGVGKIYVGHSTVDDVVAAYGKTYEAVEHGAQSSEMRYANPSLSFYYCPADTLKRIFRVEARTPFAGFTARGIILGKSTARDVVKAYGEAAPKSSSANDAWLYEYPGIEFHIEHRDSDDKPTSQLLGSRIVAIAVVTSHNGSDCLPSNAK
jgi:hypothetical protein